MPVDVILPKVDMDMTHARISCWHVSDGAVVTVGDVLFDMETDKSVMEVEAPSAGTIAHINGPIGENIPIGQVLAYIYADGETVADMAPAPVVDHKPAVHEPAHSPEPAVPPVPAQAALIADSPPASATSKPRASPSARRRAAELGMSLENVKGSGPRGRITSTDVVTAFKAQQPNAANEFAAFANQAFHYKPHSPMRRTIAERLVAASQAVPDYHLFVECRMDALLAARQTFNAQNKTPNNEHAPTVSITDCLLRALTLAYRQVPQANVAWTTDASLQLDDIDIGIAVALDDGLITPIVRRTQDLDLAAIATTRAELVARARAGKLRPDEYKGGITTLSNLGMFGIDRFTSIINPPQTSIVSIGKVREEPVVQEGKITVGQVLTATFAFDHRVIDGAVGAALAEAFCHVIHQPSDLSGISH